MTEPGHYVLAAVMIAATVISYVYYFGIFVQIFFRPADETSSVRLSIGLAIVVVICALGTLLFGIVPGLAYHFLEQFDHFSDFLQ
jgi:NADH-quinone oxidoreductase subunit N